MLKRGARSKRRVERTEGPTGRRYVSKMGLINGVKKLDTREYSQEVDHPDQRRISISVVIAWVNDLDLLIPGLESLSQQSRAPDEVIVVSRRNAAEQERLRIQYPTITILSASPRVPITVLRSLGIRQAKGDVVVVTEDHCVPDTNWLAVIEQHMERTACAIVGGPVENASTRRVRDWAAFLTEYVSVLAPASPSVEQVLLPGNNVAYRRDIALGLCEVLDQGRWESFYHQQLMEDGAKLSYERTMVVYHRRPFDVRYFISQRYYYCRSFAAMRAQTFSRSKRLAFGFASVLLPPLLVFRGLRIIIGKRRLFRRYLACLPLIVVYVTVGAAAEMVGNFFGDGGSLVRIE